MAEKQEKMAYVAEEVLKILLQRGFDAVNFAQVAKSAGVSRPWLYKYIGKTKQTLIEFGAVHFGKVYARLDVPVTCTTREEFIDHAVQGLETMLDASLQYPWILPLYFRYKGSATPMGEVIRTIESRYLAKVEHEIEQFLRPARQKPRALAEAFTWLNLGIAYDWLQSRSRDPAHRAEMAQAVRSFLEGVEARAV